MFLYLCNNFLKPFKTELFNFLEESWKGLSSPGPWLGRVRGPARSERCWLRAQWFSFQKHPTPGWQRAQAARTYRLFPRGPQNPAPLPSEQGELHPEGWSQDPLPHSPPCCCRNVAGRSGLSGGGNVEDADDLHFSASLTFEYLCKKHVCIYSVLDFSNFCILRAEHLFKHCTPTVTDLGPPSLSPVSALLINFSLKSSCARSSVSSWPGGEKILKGARGA